MTSAFILTISRTLHGNALRFLKFALKIFRFLTPSARTEDEQPITTKQLNYMQKEFNFQGHYFGILCAPIAVLTSIILRPFPNNWFISLFWIIEKQINKLIFFNKFNQYILIKN